MSLDDILRVLKDRPMESPVLPHFLTPQLKSKPVNTSAFFLAVRETNTTVLDVALEVGYEDPSYFSRAFKRSASISPSEYRHQQRLHKNGPAQQ